MSTAELPTPLLPLCLLIVLAGLAFAGMLVTEARTRWWRFRMDRIRIWMALMTKWSSEGATFEDMRERLIRRVGLEIDPLDSAALDEVINIDTTEGRGDGVVDGVDGNPQGAGLFPIHVNLVLGNIFHAVWPDSS